MTALRIPPVEKVAPALGRVAAPAQRDVVLDARRSTVGQRHEVVAGRVRRQVRAARQARRRAREAQHHLARRWRRSPSACRGARRSPGWAGAPAARSRRACRARPGTPGRWPFCARAGMPSRRSPPPLPGGALELGPCLPLHRRREQLEHAQPLGAAHTGRGRPQAGKDAVGGGGLEFVASAAIIGLPRRPGSVGRGVAIRGQVLAEQPLERGAGDAKRATYPNGGEVARVTAGSGRSADARPSPPPRPSGRGGARSSVVARVRSEQAGELGRPEHPRERSSTS